MSDFNARASDGSHVSKELVAAIESYVVEVLRILEITHWRVWVAKDLPPEDAKMMIEPTDGRRVAMLYVSPDWDNQQADQKITDILHECLHLIHHDQEYVIRRFKNEQGDVGHYAMSIVWDHFKIETERMVDQLSYILYALMPDWTFD